MTGSRQVFFVGGFDPKSARHYHRMCREAARHCPSARVTVGPREAAAEHLDAWDLHWRGPVGADPEPPALTSRYHVLRWDDIVQRHWRRGLWRAVRDHGQVYGGSVPWSLFLRVWRSAPAAFCLAMLPGVLSLGTALMAVCVAALAWWQLGLPTVGAWGVAVGLWLLLWRGLEAQVGSEWLLRLYAFSRAQVDGRVPELDARVASWATALLDRTAAAEPDSEVLVVGHSTGCLLAILVVDEVLRRRPSGAGPRLALVTLGHCVPIVTWQPRAQAYRAAVARVEADPALCWLDVCAPADWAAFARVPPWTAAGRPHQRRQVSPRWHQTLAARTYGRLLKDRQALHLHYLRSPERAGGYDPMVLTAGPLLLHQRLSAASLWSE